MDKLNKLGLIDGVGLEMHIDASHPPKKEDVLQTMKMYGVPVYITEMDVDMRNVGGSPEEKNALQARIYKEVLEAFLESGVGKSFSLWEMGDKFSWLEYPETNYTSKDANPTVFGDSLDPKPAYFALLQTLIK